MRLLLVEDDDRVAQALSEVMGRHGVTVQRAASGTGALSLFHPQVDVVVLDLSLPDVDGFDVCEQLRRRSDVPIIMATARGDLRSRIHGLYLGADDYLVKPYDLRELLARISAVVRRTGSRRETGAAADRPEGRRAARLRIEVSARQVEMDGVPVELTRKEFDLLALLAEAPGIVHARAEIMSRVWSDATAAGRTLEVHVASLRVKLGCPEAVRTVRGVGYQLGPV